MMENITRESCALGIRFCAFLILGEAACGCATHTVRARRLPHHLRPERLTICVSFLHYSSFIEIVSVLQTITFSYILLKSIHLSFNMLPRLTLDYSSYILLGRPVPLGYAVVSFLTCSVGSPNVHNVGCC